MNSLTLGFHFQNSVGRISDAKVLEVEAKLLTQLKLDAELFVKWN